MCVYLWEEGAYALAHMWNSGTIVSWFFASIVWILRIELGSLGYVTDPSFFQNTFLHETKLHHHNFREENEEKTAVN